MGRPLQHAASALLWLIPGVIRPSLAVCLVLAELMAPSVTQAAPALGSPAINPVGIVAGSSTSVTVSLPMSDPNYIRGSANLLRVNSDGSVSANLGSLQDDGTGTNTLTITVPFAESAPGTVSLRISAAFRGLLTRVLSPIAVLTVTAAQKTALATTDGTSIVFTDANGVVLRTIPLTNQELISPTPTGDAVTWTRELPVLSDDATHAGVYSVTSQADASDTEGAITSTFRYFDGSGQLWQVAAPENSAFLGPLDESGRQVTPDGSIVLLVAAGGGNANPRILVFDQSGRVVYQSTAGLFVELFQAQVSPSGRYILMMGVTSNQKIFTDLARVIDLTTGQLFDLQFDMGLSGKPLVSVSNDGRFLITVQGTQTVVPQ